MQLFGGRFDRLLAKYSVPFVFLAAEKGQYEAGVYQPGQLQRLEMYGAIFPLPEKRRYQPGGSYTESDRRLVLPKPLQAALQEARVLYQNQLYSIEEETDHSAYANVAIYLLRRAGRFPGEEGGIWSIAD